jgi:hypothetical protein
MRKVRPAAALLALCLCATGLAAVAAVEVGPPRPAVAHAGAAPAGRPPADAAKQRLPAGGGLEIARRKHNGWDPVAPGAALPLTTELKVCATARRDGHVWLEVTDSSGRIKRLPKALTADGGPGRTVAAGEHVCFGDDEVLQVDYPLGVTQLRFMWTSREDTAAGSVVAARGLASVPGPGGREVTEPGPAVKYDTVR